VLENLDKLVVKATNESGGYGMLMGHQATQEERNEFAEKIKEDPRNYIAQPIIELCAASDDFRRPFRRAVASTCGRTSCSARKSSSCRAG
jgi:uncharacterized circularly permuted ATP-grasp superfamily protein